MLAVIELTSSYVNFKLKISTQPQYPIYPTSLVKNTPLHQRNQELHVFPDPMLLPSFTQAVSLNIIQAFILKATKQKFLTDEGLAHSTALGIGLWTFLGFKGWLVCVIYLALGNFVTKVKMLEKEVCILNCVLKYRT